MFPFLHSIHRFLTRSRFVLFPWLAFAAVAQPSLAVSGPGIFLNQAEIEEIKSLVATNQQPWKSAYNILTDDAKSAYFHWSFGHANYLQQRCDCHEQLTEPREKCDLSN